MSYFILVAVQSHAYVVKRRTSRQSTNARLRPGRCWKQYSHCSTNAIANSCRSLDRSNGSTVCLNSNSYATIRRGSDYGTSEIIQSIDPYNFIAHSLPSHISHQHPQHRSSSSPLLPNSNCLPTSKLPLRSLELRLQHRTLPALHSFYRFRQKLQQLVSRRRHASPAFVACSRFCDARIVGRG
jgi:hypothetical protein